MFPHHVVLSVAPTSLRTYRQSRCRGDELALVLASFPPGERDTIVRLYETLGELASAMRGDDEFSRASRASFHDRFAKLLGVGEGLRYAAAGMTDAVAEALHDIRGGTMTALLLGLGDVPVRGRHASEETSILSLVRDQRKIIRSIVSDIDPEGLAHDAAARPHSLAELDAAVGSFGSAGRGKDLAIEIHRDADAIVAESCLEFAALERAVFNLLNNAARHVDGDVLDVWLLALEGSARVVVANPVAHAQAESLAAILDADPATLYGGFTTTGSGMGLSIVAEIVGNAYGLTEPQDLVADGYLGTKIVDDTFLTWLHWPLSSG